MNNQIPIDVVTKFSNEGSAPFRLSDQSLGTMDEMMKLILETGDSHAAFLDDPERLILLAQRIAAIKTEYQNASTFKKIARFLGFYQKTDQWMQKLDVLETSLSRMVAKEGKLDALRQRLWLRKSADASFGAIEQSVFEVFTRSLGEAFPVELYRQYLESQDESQKKQLMNQIKAQFEWGSFESNRALINQPDSQKQTTMLGYALRYGDGEMVNYLFRKGADPLVRTVVRLELFNLDNDPVVECSALDHILENRGTPGQRRETLKVFFENVNRLVQEGTITQAQKQELVDGRVGHVGRLTCPTLYAAMIAKKWDVVDLLLDEGANPMHRENDYENDGGRSIHSVWEWKDRNAALEALKRLLPHMPQLRFYVQPETSDIYLSLGADFSPIPLKFSQFDEILALVPSLGEKTLQSLSTAASKATKEGNDWQQWVLLVTKMQLDDKAIEKMPLPELRVLRQAVARIGKKNNLPLGMNANLQRVMEQTVLKVKEALRDPTSELSIDINMVEPWVGELCIGPASSGAYCYVSKGPNHGWFGYNAGLELEKLIPEMAPTHLKKLRGALDNYRCTAPDKEALIKQIDQQLGQNGRQ